MGFYNAVAQLGSVILPIGLGSVLDVTAMNCCYVLMTIAAAHALCELMIAFVHEKPVAYGKLAAASA